MSLTKEDKIKELKNKKIEVPIEDFPTTFINKLYKDHILSKQIVKKDIDKTTDKYKVLLEFVNGILKNIGKDEIDDLTKFVKIDRRDILKEENKVLLENMKDKLFEHFDKQKSGYYKKSQAFVLNVLKGFCRQLGLKIICTRKQTSKNYKVKMIFYYTITNI